MSDEILLTPGGSPSVVTVTGYNEIAFGAGNIGYRLCGPQVWIGAFGGNLNGNAGNGNGTMTIFKNGGASTGSSGKMEGSMVLNALGYLSGFSFSSSTNSDARLVTTDASSNLAYKGSITGSYTTLAGSFYAKSGTNSLQIKQDGTLSGGSLLGFYTGTITAFHSDTQVHDVSLTFSGGRILKGILAPYGALPGRVPAQLPSGDDSQPAVMLIVGDTSAAWGDVFSKR